MRKAVVLGMVLALVTMVFAAVPMKVSAPELRDFAPKRGRSGKVNIIGEDLSGIIVKVKFGSVEAPEPEVINDKVIRVEVPPRNVLDPNPVEITVTFDGEPPLGDMWFLYDPAGPEPQITDFKPPMAIAGIPFTLELTGTDFMTPHGRVPNQIFLISPAEVIGGTVVVGTETDTSFTAEFLAATSGIYEILVGFNDGSGASAEGFEVTP